MTVPSKKKKIYKKNPPLSYANRETAGHNQLLSYTWQERIIQKGIKRWLRAHTEHGNLEGTGATMALEMVFEEANTPDTKKTDLHNQRCNENLS